MASFICQPGWPGPLCPIKSYSHCLCVSVFWVILTFKLVSLMAQWWRTTYQCRRHWFDPWIGKIPRRRKWQPTLLFLLGKSHGQRSLVVYSPWGHKRVWHGLATRPQQPLSQWTLNQIQSIESLNWIQTDLSQEKRYSASRQSLDFDFSLDLHLAGLHCKFWVGTSTIMWITSLKSFSLATHTHTLVVDSASLENSDWYKLLLIWETMQCSFSQHF